MGYPILPSFPRLNFTIDRDIQKTTSNEAPDPHLSSQELSNFIESGRYYEKLEKKLPDLIQNNDLSAILYLFRNAMSSALRDKNTVLIKNLAGKYAEIKKGSPFTSATPYDLMKNKTVFDYLEKLAKDQFAII